MERCNSYTLNLGGTLMETSIPLVMGIVNATPDSFHEHASDAESIVATVERMIRERADIIDIGGMSTRPGASDVSEEEEWRRLAEALELVKSKWPQMPISVDTFRPTIAERCICEYGAQIINDISGGCKEMFEVVARTKTPYILTFNEKRKPEMDIIKQMMLFFAERVQMLRNRGQADIILDPGFGFNKSVEDNFRLMSHLDCLKVLNLPVLVGISRKSMIYKTLECTPNEALNGTTALHMTALDKGANILRVHDVAEAKQCIKLKTLLNSPSKE